MHELEFEKLTATKARLEYLLDDFEQTELLDKLWKRIEQWYYNEAQPEEIYVTDRCMKHFHKELEHKEPIHAQNLASCLSREWRCPYCGNHLQIEYCQNERYIVRCPCRIQWIRATSPEKAAKKVGFTFHPYNTWSEWDDTLPAGGIDLQWYPADDHHNIEGTSCYTGSPLDHDWPYNETDEEHLYYAQQAHLTPLPEQPTNE